MPNGVTWQEQHVHIRNNCAYSQGVNSQRDTGTGFTWYNRITPTQTTPTTLHVIQTTSPIKVSAISPSASSPPPDLRSGSKTGQMTWCLRRTYLRVSDTKIVRELKADRRGSIIFDLRYRHLGYVGCPHLRSKEPLNARHEMDC